MQTQEIGNAAPPVQAFGLAGGCTVVVAAAFGAAAVVPAGQPAGRAVLLAVTVAVLAAVLSDALACAGSAVLAALIFVGFLAHRDGVLTGDPSAWRYTAVIVGAAVLARVARRFLTRS